MKKTLFLAAFFTCVTMAQASNYTDAAGDHDWLNGLNWNPNGAPGSTKTAYLNAGTTARITGTEEAPLSVEALTLWMWSGSTLEISHASLNIAQMKGTSNDAILLGNGSTNTDTTQLILKEGANLTSSDANIKMYIGFTAGQTAYVKVEKGATLNLGTTGTNEYGEIEVGQNGKGILEIDGGTVISSYGRIGNQGGTTGTMPEPGNGAGDGLVTIDNGGSWYMSKDLYISNRYGARGVLNINDGTVETGTYVSIGEKYSTPNSAFINLNGPDAVLKGGTYLYVGHGADGVLNVNDGLVSFKDVQIGGSVMASFLYYTYGSGVINMTGGEIEASNSFAIGYAARTGYTTDMTKPNGYVKLENDAIISTNTITVGNNSSGVLEIATDQATLRNYAKNGLAVISGGNSATAKGLVKFTHSGYLEFNNQMKEYASNRTNLKVEHSGTGTTILNGINSYANGTDVLGGVLVSNNQNGLGTGLVTINGGVLETSVFSTNVGSIALIDGILRVYDTRSLTPDDPTIVGLAGELRVTNTFSMTGGTYELDILSLNDFDAVLGNSTKTLTLSGGVLDLSGYAGFEGVLGSTGYEYAIFSGFAAMGQEIVDGQGSFTINGYDKDNWIAKIRTDGTLYFETLNPVPEPTTATLALLGLSSLILRRKRSNQ